MWGDEYCSTCLLKYLSRALRVDSFHPFLLHVYFLQCFVFPPGSLRSFTHAHARTRTHTHTHTHTRTTTHFNFFFLNCIVFISNGRAGWLPLIFREVPVSILSPELAVIAQDSLEVCCSGWFIIPYYFGHCPLPWCISDTGSTRQANDGLVCTLLHIIGPYTDITRNYASWATISFSKTTFIHGVSSIYHALHRPIPSSNHPRTHPYVGEVVKRYSVAQISSSKLWSNWCSWDSRQTRHSGWELRAYALNAFLCSRNYKPAGCST
jgi:hypothetical protein